MVEENQSSRESEPSDEPSATQQSADNTLVLLRRAQSGDGAAMERLCARCMPRLRRWASGRLPVAARGLLDTDDLVQETIVRSIQRLDRFEPRHEGAFQAYLRQAVQNRIRDEARRVGRRPASFELDGNEVDPQPSPFEVTVGRELAARYEAAYTRLGPDDQEAIFLRLEMNYDYQEIAAALDKPSANAARMAVSRGLVRLAREMRDETGS